MNSFRKQEYEELFRHPFYKKKLELVTLWPKFDEEWHKGREWIEPKEKVQRTGEIYSF